MKQFLSCMLLVLGAISGAVGQSFRAYVKAGDQAIEQSDYYAAMYYFENALERKPNDLPTLYKTAEAARLFNAYEEAVKYYTKVVKKDKTGLFPLAYFWLGKMTKQMGDYEGAIKYFEDYLNQPGGDPPYLAKARTEITSCEQAQLALQSPAEVDVVQMNKRINTAYSEFGAYQSGDTLYYTSYRYDKKAKGNVPERKISKVLISIRGSKGRTLRRGFNSDEKHTAHTTFNSDQSRIYYTVCDFVEESAAIRCQLFFREKDSRKRWKSSGLALPGSINMPGFTATHPSIGYDSILQTEVLYFVSDRPGGKGGLDIWWSTWDQEKNKFSDPKNLEQINTTADDITPFFHQASQILYFSSEGYDGLGGFDIYQTNRGPEWGRVEALKPPINSSYNDIYYFLNQDGETGYLSSNRLGSFYLDRRNKTCCNDIYTFKPKPPTSPVDSVPSPTVTKIPPVEQPIVTTTPMVPETLEDFLPLALYFDNDEPDKRTRRTTTRKTYEDTFEKYYARKDQYQQAFADALDEDDRAEAEGLIDAFFEDEVKRGYDFLFKFSEILLKRLEAGDEVEIFIKGFTSPRAQSDYNLQLGQRRISSLRNHFSTYSEGIFLSYLQSGQLTITERSFGETTASQDVSDDLADLRNSIYSPAAARERRVEIQEIKRKEN